MTSKYLQNDWQQIRELYKDNILEIMAAPPYHYGIDPYEWDMGRDIIHMTPIERAMWCDIRCTGIVMYPQWPTCGVFLDFANPVAKVAIECDGKEFHDPEEDAKRDARLASVGWNVFRMKGSDCLLNGTEDERGRYHLSPGELLCNKLARDFKISQRYAGN